MRDLGMMTKHVSKLLALASLAVIALLWVAAMPLFGDAESPQAVSSQPAVQKVVPASAAQVDLSFAPLVKQVSPAVVNLYTEKTVAQRQTMAEALYGIRPRTTRVQNSLGSGVIVRPDGVIVTNNHVIRGADAFRVVLSDRREFPAEVLLADERTDLAVLKINPGNERLPVVPLADTRLTEVGDIVLAIGNPFGVGQTVTSGIVSATARTDVGITDYSFFIQTDAAVNPGNSGGALINNRGELVGVNTAIYSRTGGSVGIGFAIPAEMVKRVVDAAVDGGTFVRPWLGLSAQSVSYDIAKSQGLDRPLGVMVTEVYPEGPAARAGLRRGDLITTIDGREVFDEAGLKFLAAIRSPGEEAQLTVLRGGSLRTFRVRVDAPPGATQADLVLLSGPHVFNGAQVVELSPRLAEQLGLDPVANGNGVLVHSVVRRTVASNLFQPGDIIRSVNDTKVRNVKDLQSALSRAASSWTIEVERNGRVIKGTVRI